MPVGHYETAKFRQDIPYLTSAWTRSYKVIRSHNEGINGRLKSGDLDIGNPKHRPAPGRVAQTLLVAILVTAGNLDILETWLHQRTGRQLTDTDYDSLPRQITEQDEQPPPTGRPPPTGHHPSG